MTDLKFETRAELEAWAKEAEARAVYVWGDKALLGGDAFILGYRRALIRHVTLAHSHLIGDT